MAGFIKGDVVVVPFPYSDLSQSKRRPAVVVKPRFLLACKAFSRKAESDLTLRKCFRVQ